MTTAALILALAACSEPSADLGPDTASAGTSPEAGQFDPPAAVGAFAPNLASLAGGLAATWLEPVATSEPAAHRLRFARLERGVWTDPVTIVEGSELFANWADFPELVETADGTLFAHWLAKTASDTYAYSVFVARSADRGATWRRLGKLNADETHTEHGFVSWLPETGGARAFWLDGREMPSGGPMTLRTARLGREPSPGPTGEQPLDPRVCECCGTDAAMTSRGPIVVYRDRSETEVRDVFAVRRTAGGWSAPRPVHADGWTIRGCPVNGPAVDASGDGVAVAWFTASDDTPRVMAAFSLDAGETFGPPVTVDVSGDGNLVLGRVDLSLEPDGSARLVWLTQVDEAEAELRMRRVGRAGVLDEPRVVSRTSPARATGFPVLESTETGLYLAWVEIERERSSSRIRVRAL